MPRFVPELFALRPWYHDFGSLGVDTVFLEVGVGLGEGLGRALELVSYRVRRTLPGPRTGPRSRGGVRSPGQVFRRLPTSHTVNQPVKEKHLLAFIRQALATLPSAPSCLDLFCADGYYGYHVKKLSPKARVTGVDLDADHLRRAAAIAPWLDVDPMILLHEDVLTFLDDAAEAYDLVVCAGGLYHVDAPRSLLEKLAGVARGFVVVQSVVTMETEDPGYCVAPAPGWQHGCRFTHAWLRERLATTGWELVAESRAELPGNRRLQDRGSSFFLCRAG